jgi:RNA binding exosome subunit
MKLANSIKVTVFAKPEENEDKIRDKLISFFPFNLEEEKIPVKRSRAVSFSQRQISIYKVELSKERHTNAFLKLINSKLDTQQRCMLLSQENRLDDNLDFFIRLSKEHLLNNEYMLTDCGDCYHIRISIAAFPRKREVALAVVKKVFNYF